MKRKMEKLHPAYVAGFLDGEGTIRINKSYTKARGVRYELQVCAVNTDPRPLIYLQKKYGGGVYTRKLVPRYKNAYCWTLGQHAALKVLEEVLPYLVIKKERAELALEFSKAQTSMRGMKKENKPVEIELRRLYYEQMKQLNR